MITRRQGEEAPTQRMRDMLEELRYGTTKYAYLTAELDRVEEALGLPVTTPNDERE